MEKKFGSEIVHVPPPGEPGPPDMDKVFPNISQWSGVDGPHSLLRKKTSRGGFSPKPIYHTKLLSIYENSNRQK